MILYTVVPCYNEAECLDETCSRLLEKYSDLIVSGKISEESRILFVDDGSSDNTWERICAHFKSSRLISGIKFSRNFGHQNAVYAGLTETMDKYDAAISIDADLQDDITVIDEMIEKYQSGCDIVYGVRNDRHFDSFIKRSTADLYYLAMKLLGAEIIYNHADFRLMSSRAVRTLSEFKENRIFLRGLVPRLGYKSESVYYERKERTAGKSKYSFKRMSSLALNGVFSFTTTPIDCIVALGAVMIILSLISYLALLFCSADKVSWLISSLFFCCGLVILAVGTIGEYIGIIMHESKQRPRYIIEDRL